ncbi:hypothetical protein A3B18_02990 [Candidatus Giovannonibacteria bacterium RIFCSPLOWO2_01_FULL_46_13]|uniref:Peptidoglycan binding-like domain-containing protein n=1 Tax=Candidatus Giovannonibacteria bacterium RIFCSPLOWO2_01_FULL_46_13 TaxID=1798352 RepID=A0A1F5X312_9BACT|nr:MAG: hypothetical protein A3B18_02990 [Candidatus Giovannonibacteria bacterium RIFCSPLOWO2_01_FULL_46_13]
MQRYLNWAGFRIALIGSGSPGNETTYFGNLTRQAVMRWQEANRAEVLTPLGLPNGTGVFGMASFNAYVRIVRIALGVGS